MILGYAVCNVSVMPMRAEPAHSAEQVSQLLFGERMQVLDRNKKGWLKVWAEWDNYEGWIKEGQATIIDFKQYKKPLHFITTGLQAQLHLSEGSFMLSPGSSLWGLKKGTIQLGTLQFTFKGKRTNLKQSTFSAEHIQVFTKLFAGTPYQWGGRSLMGIDCSGLVQIVYKMMNIQLPRDASQQATVGETIGFLQEAQCGDLAFFDNELGNINHVGILLNNHTIVHATDTSGCVVTDPIDNGGIISRRLRTRTHNLRLIKRIVP